MKGYSKFVILLVVALMFLSSIACGIIGPGGCPNGSAPGVVNGQKACVPVDGQAPLVSLPTNATGDVYSTVSGK